MPTMRVGERSLFIHVPKTGGMWATEAMQASGLKLQEPTIVREVSHSLHRPARSLDTDGLYVFGFVRHPLDWWLSYWRFRMWRGWQESNVIDRRAKADDFNEFIENVVERIPGKLGQLYRAYLGGPRKADYIGRVEDLPGALVEALRAGGEEFDEGRLLATPPQNVTEAPEAAYDPALAERLLEAEAIVVQIFYSEHWPPSSQPRGNGT